ncbi:MAG: hypothetical protein JW966_07725 [Anaerolineae bacterium]|nr:hypothetical protein [Anaerolineae bacterium]
MQRLNYMLKTEFDLSDLERKSKRLVQFMDDKIEELDSVSPELDIREYFARLAEEFTEMPFNPLGDVWEEEIRRIFDDSDSE